MFKKKIRFVQLVRERRHWQRKAARYYKELKAQRARTRNQLSKYKRSMADKLRHALLNQASHYQLYVIYAGVTSLDVYRTPSRQATAFLSNGVLGKYPWTRPTRLLCLADIHKIVFTKPQLLALYKSVSKGHSTMGQTILKMTKKNTMTLEHAIKSGLLNVANLPTFNQFSSYHDSTF